MKIRWRVLTVLITAFLLASLPPTIGHALDAEDGAWAMWLTVVIGLTFNQILGYWFEERRGTQS